MKIEIAEYNPQWENDFLNLQKIIADILKDPEPVIEHIGSTSVKGLGAKAIIDIMVGVKNQYQLDLIPEKLIKHGFTYYRIYNEIMPERRFLVKLVHPDNHIPPEYYDKDEQHPGQNGFNSIVNCHSVVINSEFWDRHLAFRNYLRNHDQARDEYNKLKKELSTRDWQDRNDYTDAKTDFIKNIEARALIVNQIKD
jgi:GrpB-like predicted nucleotidyltransferase (UPF0157 family)